MRIAQGLAVPRERNQLQFLREILELPCGLFKDLRGHQLACGSEAPTRILFPRPKAVAASEVAALTQIQDHRKGRRQRQPFAQNDTIGMIGGFANGHDTPRLDFSQHAPHALLHGVQHRVQQVVTVMTQRKLITHIIICQ